MPNPKPVISLIAFLLVTSFFTGRLAAETDLKIRAREHFDTVWISHKNLNRTYSYGGIGPTINVWLEDPYRFSFGLSYSVLFINNSKEAETPDFGSNMDLTKFGFEGKIYLNRGKGGCLPVSGFQATY